MTEAVRREAGSSRLSHLVGAGTIRRRGSSTSICSRCLIAVLLPWSTTGVAIAAVLWLIALVPTIEPRALLRSLARPVCALPIALFALVVAGTAVVGRAVGRPSHRGSGRASC